MSIFTQDWWTAFWSSDAPMVIGALLGLIFVEVAYALARR